jgi:hypothetical protein
LGEIDIGGIPTMTLTKLSYLWRELSAVKWTVFFLLCIISINSCNEWIDVGKIENDKYLVWAQFDSSGDATVPVYFRIYYKEKRSLFGISHKLMNTSSCPDNVRFALSSNNILFYSNCGYLDHFSKNFFMANLDCPKGGVEMSCRMMDAWKDKDTLAEKVSGFMRARQGNLKNISDLSHISITTDYHLDENKIMTSGPSADLFVINAEKTELIDVVDKNIVFAVKWYCRNKPDTFSFPILEHEKMATDPDWINSIFDKRK